MENCWTMNGTRRAAYLLLLASLLLLSAGSAPTHQSTGVVPGAIRGPGAQTAQVSSEVVYHPGVIDRIRVVEYPSTSSALAAVALGEADLFGERVPEDYYSAVESLSGLKTMWAPDNVLHLLAINAMSYPLDNSHLRRAVAFAIDKQGAVPSPLRGHVDVVDFALPLMSEFSIEATEGGLFYDPDPSSAVDELELAGMLDVDGDGMVEAPNGEPVHLTLWAPSDRTGFVEAAQRISTDLLAVGINNTVVPLPHDTIQYEVARHNKTYDLALYEQEVSPHGLDWTATTFSWSRRNEPGQNIANINDPTLNHLAYKYMTTIEYDGRVAWGIKAMRAVRDLCPVVPLFAERWLSVYNDVRLEGWVDDPFGGAISVWQPVSVRPRPGAPSEMVVAVTPSFFDEFFTSLNPLFKRTCLMIGK